MKYNYFNFESIYIYKECWNMIFREVKEYTIMLFYTTSLCTNTFSINIIDDSIINYFIQNACSIQINVKHLKYCISEKHLSLQCKKWYTVYYT